MTAAADTKGTRRLRMLAAFSVVISESLVVDQRAALVFVIAFVSGVLFAFECFRYAACLAREESGAQ